MKPADQRGEASMEDEDDEIDDEVKVDDDHEDEVEPFSQFVDESEPSRRKSQIFKFFYKTCL